MNSIEVVSETEIIAQITILLEKLGPFSPDTPRQNKWRTSEQLAYELMQLGFKVDLDRVEEALRGYETGYRERLQNLRPEAKIRRATYPDRTTALPLWGSTKYHGQPWLAQASAERLDPPDDIPSSLYVAESAPRAFSSHTHRDADIAGRLSTVLARMGMGA
jgi:hypothetical protein